MEAGDVMAKKSLFVYKTKSRETIDGMEVFVDNKFDDHAVEGYGVNIPETDRSLFIASFDDQYRHLKWRLYDVLTGFYVCSGSTQKETIARAREMDWSKLT